jgi:hypothetical protein
MICRIYDVNRYMDVGLGQAIQDVMQENKVPEPKVTEMQVHNVDWLG